MPKIILKYDEIYAEVEKLSQFVMQDISQKMNRDGTELQSILEEMDGKTKDELAEMLAYQQERNASLTTVFMETLAFIIFSTSEVQSREQSIANKIQEV